MSRVMVMWFVVLYAFAAIMFLICIAVNRILVGRRVEKISEELSKELEEMRKESNILMDKTLEEREKMKEELKDIIVKNRENK